MTTKKEIVLNPKAEFIDKSEELKSMLKLDEEKSNSIQVFNDNVKKSVIQLDSGGGNSESLFKSVIEDLRNIENVSSKTELIDTNEVFAVTKMDFLSQMFDFPALKKFTEQFKVNRISLERQGRQELIMAMAERRQEIERENRVNAQERGFMP